MLATPNDPNSNNHRLPYRGRFAPSPTGPLHFGSLACAVASFLQARANGGTWLVRVEDLDPPREMPGATDEILRTLEKHQLFWDETVVYQSQRHNRYQHWLEQLSQRELIYRCRCSRKQIQERQNALGIAVYPGTCKDEALDASQDYAVRVKSLPQTITFEDRIQGRYGHNVATEVGDFVVRRTDGWFAYQLAVVADDAEQHITEVVRGSDLLNNTPRQIYLQQQLDLQTPHYAHIPVATNQSGEKLSKQTSAASVNCANPMANILKTLEFLGQNPPPRHQFDTLEAVWQWAIEHWTISHVPKVMGIIVDD